MRQTTKRPWTEIRRDFEAGATYRALVEKYGGYAQGYRERARREKWKGADNRHKKYGSTAPNGSSAAPNGSMTKRRTGKKPESGDTQTSVTVALGDPNLLHLRAKSISLDKDGVTIRL